MAALPKSREFALPDEGEHVLKLMTSTIERITSAYPDGKSDDQKADVLVLTFASNKKDDDGNRQELRLLLPPAISSRNKTGKLAKKLVPGIDPDVDEFDPDELVGRVWSAYVSHEETKGGKTIAWPTSMKPYVAAKTDPKTEPKPEPKPAPADDFDPFAD
jgi:hypothetical protein